MPAPETGNTLLPPPRLTGDAKKDGAVLQRYLTDMYQAFVLARNLIGTVEQQAAQIAALQQQVADLDSRVTDLE